jgi:hypothetical protein
LELPRDDAHQQQTFSLFGILATHLPERKDRQQPTLSETPNHWQKAMRMDGSISFSGVAA